MCPSVSFSQAKNASREETHVSGRFLARRGSLYVIPFLRNVQGYSRSFFEKKKKMNSRTDDCTCWLMWYFMSMVIFNRLTILFRITSYASWLRNGNNLFVTGAQMCWIYNRELSLKLRFLGMGVYIRHRRGNSACAEILTPPQDGGVGMEGVGRMGSKQGEI